MRTILQLNCSQDWFPINFSGQIHWETQLPYSIILMYGWLGSKKQDYQFFVLFSVREATNSHGVHDVRDDKAR